MFECLPVKDLNEWKECVQVTMNFKKQCENSTEIVLEFLKSMDSKKL